MPAERWFFVFGEEPVGPAKSGLAFQIVHECHFPAGEGES